MENSKGFFRGEKRMIDFMRNTIMSTVKFELESGHVPDVQEQSTVISNVYLFILIHSRKLSGSERTL